MRALAGEWNVPRSADMPNEKNVSDQILERLGEWGVSRMFGYPGDGINGLMGALRRAGDRYDFVQVAHEELAGLMACAHSKYTGELGVCICTSGPGAVHMLNGLYDAKLDHQPVLAIVGQQPLFGLGGDSQQEIDLRALLENVSEYVEMIAKPEQVRFVVDRAIRTAIGRRGVSCIILPHDVQRAKATEAPPHKHGMEHSSRGYVPPRMMPRDEELRKAADVLNAGQRVAILVGAGALGATDEVIRAAELLGAGVAKALLGKAALPDDLPFVTGSVGWLGTAASNTMMKECDTLFMIGSSCPYTEYLPKEGQARGVQIDILPGKLGLRYPMEVALAGDAAETLRALIPLLKQKTDRSWRDHVEQLVSKWWAKLDKHAHSPAEPLNPQLLFWELSRQIPDNALVSADCGSSTVWIARHLKIRRGMKFSLSGSLATMGGGIPYALAAKIAFPDRPVVGTQGDGAMQMSGLASLIDVSKYWRKWKDPRFVILVLNNRDLNYVSWEQRVMEGEPKFEKSQTLPDFDYARYAESLGLRGIRVDDPGDVEQVWREALTADRPVVINAITNADVPPLPPELTQEQEEHLAQALADGDADADGVEAQMMEQEIGASSE